MSKPQPGSPCADTPGSEALITDTGGQDQGATYCLAANTNPSIGLQVYALNMPPGWSDPAYALEPPFDGNNAVNGAPYPSLISASGRTGTYSLMYRNEPLPLRVNDPQDGASGLTPEEQQKAVDSVVRLQLHPTPRCGVEYPASAWQPYRSEAGIRV